MREVSTEAFSGCDLVSKLLTKNQVLNFKRIYWLLAFEFLMILFLSLFSKPFRELGLASWLPWKLSAFGKVGRVIFVYHSLAIPFVCALLYLYFFIADSLLLKIKF